MKGSDSLAAIVSAYNFTLVDPVTGLVAAELKSNVFALQNSGLQLYHNRADVRDSALVWSDNAPVSSTAQLILWGPASFAANGGASALTATADGVSGAATTELGASGNNGWGLVKSSHLTPETNTVYLDAYSGPGGLGNYAQVIATANAAGANSSSLQAGGGQIAVTADSAGPITLLSSTGDVRAHMAGALYVRNAAGSVTRMVVDASGLYLPDPMFLRIGGTSNASGNLRFDAANPYIYASSYIYIPGGAYFNSGIVYFQAQMKARGGITNDSGRMHIYAGSDGFLQLNDGAGLILADSNTVADGTYPRMMRRGADGVMFYATSARRTKTRIKSIRPKDAGRLLDALRPVSFHGRRGKNATDAEWEWDRHDLHRGFIAEEVAAVDPYLAQYSLDKAGNLEAVGWREPAIVALLVSTVQELRKELAAVREEIAAITRPAPADHVR